MAEAVAEMKRRHPRDVLGRLADICKPNSSRYNVAIAVLMGRQMDSVVVRTFEVGRACVALLKELRTEPMEFIPLDNIAVRRAACRRLSSCLLHCVPPEHHTGVHVQGAAPRHSASVLPLCALRFGASRFGW